MPGNSALVVAATAKTPAALRGTYLGTITPNGNPANQQAVTVTFSSQSGNSVQGTMVVAGGGTFGMSGQAGARKLKLSFNGSTGTGTITGTTSNGGRTIGGSIVSHAGGTTTSGTIALTKQLTVAARRRRARVAGGATGTTGTVGTSTGTTGTTGLGPTNSNPGTTNTGIGTVGTAPGVGATTGIGGVGTVTGVGTPIGGVTGVGTTGVGGVTGIGATTGIGTTTGVGGITGITGVGTTTGIGAASGLGASGIGVTPVGVTGVGGTTGLGTTGFGGTTGLGGSSGLGTVGGVSAITGGIGGMAGTFSSPTMSNFSRIGSRRVSSGRFGPHRFRNTPGFGNGVTISTTFPITPINPIAPTFPINPTVPIFPIVPPVGGILSIGIGATGAGAFGNPTFGAGSTIVPTNNPTSPFSASAIPAETSFGFPPGPNGPTMI